MPSTKGSLQWIIEQISSLSFEGNANALLDNNRVFGANTVSRDIINVGYTMKSTEAMEEGHSWLKTFVNVNVANGVVQNFRWNPQRGRLLGVSSREYEEPTSSGDRSYFLNQSNPFSGYAEELGAVTSLSDGTVLISGSRISSELMRLWFLREPKPLVSGAVASYTAGTRSLVTGALEYGAEFEQVADYYADEFIIISSGAGRGQMARVDTFDPSTGTFVLREIDTHGDTVFAVEPDATSKWSLHPWFPTQYCDFLSMYGLVSNQNLAHSLDYGMQLTYFTNLLDKFIQREDLVSKEHIGKDVTMQDLTEGGGDGYGHYLGGY